jgi:hypothetical protein
MSLRWLTLALGLGVSGAQAAELSGGPIDGGFAQRVAVCYFFNAGTAAVTLANPRITNIGGSSVTLTTNQCGSGRLGVFQTCGIAASISNSTIYSCKVSVTPAKRDVRGILEVRDVNGVTIQNIELR